ncbi:MAG TPA: large conductance mechanosensitive channel protein MscL [Saprospiraceae bacterium]|nr:large conductance mechanosensitive channel protein MscL [Saprospiraceae bacterium]
MLKEFREFALKGNMIDMAVGIVIGAAFGTVVKSIVDDLLMPVIASIFETPDFNNLFIRLKNTEASFAVTGLREFREAGGVAFAYGNFINAAFAFILVAFAVWIVVRSINKLKKAEETPAAPAGPTSEELLTQIRDLLKNRA